ncbi:MAG: polysaccharide deacetylase family protein [Halanaerobiales bacterium]
MNKGQTNRLLGYPDDARLLIINADDFGMCHSVNEAIISAFEQGIVSSTTLMVPCPWAEHAMRFLILHPEISFGIHLTVISEWANYRWRPVSSREMVPSLLDETGYFYNFERMSELLTQVKLDQLETEFRAQIEIVLKAGLRPTHLDWHALRIGDRKDIFNLMYKLAKEYGLALRVRGQSIIEEIQRKGLPTSDYDFLDSYVLDPLDKPSIFKKMLRELPNGLSEWAVHPGLDSPELRTIEIDNRYRRQKDFDFLISKEAKEIVKQEGIIILDYSSLQVKWRQIL